MRDEDTFSGDAMSADKGRGVYVYIQTDDVDTKYAALKEQGFTPATEPRDWNWGNREFILKDPDDYKLCFRQPIRSN